MKQAALATWRPALALFPLMALGLCAPAACAQTAPYRWQNVKIGGGGFVTGIVAHPKQPGLRYARTDVGGAYRWDDNGKTWVPLNDAFDVRQWTWTGVESIGLDPTDPNRLYLAVGTYTNNWGGPGAMLRSSDQGKHFQRVDLPFKNGANEDGRWMGERIAVDPDHPNRVFFGTRTSGLWQSVDGGAAWKPVAGFPAVSDPQRIGVVWVTFAPKRAQSARSIFASVHGKDGGLYQSRDAGATWEKVPGQPEGMTSGQGRWGADGLLYLTYSNAPGPNGATDGAVWKYQPSGDKWTDITPHKSLPNLPACAYAGLAVSARQPGTLLVATLDRWSIGDDLFRSTDGGATWKPIASTLR